MSDELKGPRWITAAEYVEQEGRQFQSASIARVDPSGDDSTGRVGELTLPFLTVQGAIDAIEDGSFQNPTIDVGASVFTEDVTTALLSLSFLGTGLNSTPYNSITFTEANESISIFLVNLAANAGPISAATAGTLSVEIINSLVSDIINTAGPLQVLAYGNSELQSNIGAPGFAVTIVGPNNATGNVQLDSAGSAVTVKNCTVALIAAASIILIDSRLVENDAGITPTYADVLLANPIFPDSDPHIAGAGYWGIADVFTKSTG